jgi:hypothetical protein
MDRKGILLPAHEQNLGNAGFEFVKERLPKLLPKFVTVFVFIQIVRTIDNLILHRMPDNLKTIFIPFIDAAFEGRYEEMRRQATDVFAGLVDWKGVTKDTQLYLYDSGTRFIVALAMSYAEKKQWAENA